MPRRDNTRSLVDLIRAVVNETIPQASDNTRVPATLSGVVEDLDEDLDVVYVRMDSEAIGSDPTQSDNYEQPGVIPASRLGETFRGEQARVDFQGPAGGQAMRTGIQSRIVLPFGAEDGRRIILDGDVGVIEFYNGQGELVGVFDSDQLTIGDIENLAERVTIDPLSGFRLRDGDDDLVAILDQNGYTLRNSATGQVSAEIKATGSMRLVDPNGTDDIEMVTTSLGNLPNPNYVIDPQVSPGTTINLPAANIFNTLPPDDLAIGAAIGWHSNALQGSATMTPPTGWTEISDTSNETSSGSDQISMHTATASLHPADGLSGTFTSTDSWEHALGQHVIIRGGGDVSPSIRSSTTSVDVFPPATSQASIDIDTPAGVVDGDVLVVFVTVGTKGGFVPTSWTTPAGWVFLGADFSSSGSGSTQSTVGGGCWVKLADNEPATQQTTISLPAGLKMAQGHMIAVRDALLTPGGVQIRLAGRPIRRLLDIRELDSPSMTLCDFTDIPPGYDNLEIVWDAASIENPDASARLVRWRFNGDTGSNYFDRRVVNGTAQAQRFGVTDMRVAARFGQSTGGKSAGSMHIYGYTSSSAPIVVSQGYCVDGLVIENHSGVGQWNRTGPINRIQGFLDDGGVDIAAGSRVYLYGY